MSEVHVYGLRPLNFPVLLCTLWKVLHTYYISMGVYKLRIYVNNLFINIDEAELKIFHSLSFYILSSSSR